ncbi:hypothetical protein BKA63DRAFT_555425 [Paraphoma chrysanthemicola]|nr:hypothetical protein BKA63DRAFT_555425 [Paraphoma chrysanthemicola]
MSSCDSTECCCAAQQNINSPSKCPACPKSPEHVSEVQNPYIDSSRQVMALTLMRRQGLNRAMAGFNRSEECVEGSGRPTYTVATKEWIALADFIAGKVLPVTVPVKLASLLELTITLRQSYSNDVSNILDDTAEKRKSDDSHRFFLDILKKVRAILEPRLPKDRLSPAQPQTAGEIVNMFEHLELEEPSETPEATTSNLPAATESQAHVEPTYKAELSTAWAGYKSGMHDLVAASITTNTAVDLARSMTDDLKGTFTKHREAHLNPTPEMKHGIYGFYEPHSDRDGKTNRDKFKEDKISPLEMLPEFFYYCRTIEPVASRPPVEDEFGRGSGTCSRRKRLLCRLHLWLHYSSPFTTCFATR